LSMRADRIPRRPPVQQIPVNSVRHLCVSSAVEGTLWKSVRPDAAVSRPDLLIPRLVRTVFFTRTFCLPRSLLNAELLAGTAAIAVAGAISNCPHGAVNLSRAHRLAQVARQTSRPRARALRRCRHCALASLFHESFPTVVRRVAKRFGSPPVAELRALQSGRAADYVSGLSIGVSRVGGLFGRFDLV
jgi:hypothetical protein